MPLFRCFMALLLLLAGSLCPSSLWPTAGPYSALRTLGTWELHCLHSAHGGQTIFLSSSLKGSWLQASYAMAREHVHPAKGMGAQHPGMLELGSWPTNRSHPQLLSAADAIWQLLRGWLYGDADSVSQFFMNQKQNWQFIKRHMKEHLTSLLTDEYNFKRNILYHI